MDYHKLASRYKQFGGFGLVIEYAKHGALWPAIMAGARCLVKRQSFKAIYPEVLSKIEPFLIQKYGSRVQEFKSLRVRDSPDTNHVPRLLFLSNLIESKGVLVLLDALKLLKDKGYSFICDFVGGETKEIDAKRFAEEVEKRGLNELALYQGRKYGEEKEMALTRANIFVLPTVNDCFPLVLLEAMQYGLPCVTTDEGGIRDIVVNDSGFTVHRSSQGELAKETADAMEKLITDAELRTTMGKAGRTRLEEMFTEEVFEKRMKGLLVESLGINSGS